MEKTQFKSHQFNQLNVFDNWSKNFVDTLEHPASWFTGADSNPFGDPKKFEAARKKDPVARVIQADIIKPVENKVTNTFDWVKDEVKTIESDIKYLGQEALIAGKFVVKEAETIASDGYYVGRGLYRFATKTIYFVENYYVPILFAGGSFLAARYVNEIKQVL